MEKKTIIAIPARLESSRLPQKLAADINGKSLLARVIERCKLNKHKCKVIVCTDSEALANIAKKCNVHVFKTSKNCKSGTERIASIIWNILEFLWEKDFTNKSSTEKKKFLVNSNIINVQGDQPFLNTSIVDKMISKLQQSDSNSEIITPLYELKPENIHNPNIVKTLVNKDGLVIYFSRSAIPHIRDLPKEEWHLRNKYWGHVGIYGFRSDVLRNWDKMGDSKLENLEKLEQLRFIEEGYKIGTFLTTGDSLSIDTPEQLKIAQQIAKAKNI